MLQSFGGRQTIEGVRSSRGRAPFEMGEHALSAPVNSKRLTSALPRARERSGLSGLVIPRRRTVSIIVHCRVRYGGVAECEVLHDRAGQQLQGGELGDLTEQVAQELLMKCKQRDLGSAAEVLEIQLKVPEQSRRAK